MKLIKTLLIDLRVKDQFELNLNEIAILEIVYQLSTNPSAMHQNWCYATKDYLAKNIDVSKRTVINVLSGLEEKGLIEKAVQGTLIRTTNLYNLTKFQSNAEFAQGVQNVTDGEKIALVGENFSKSSEKNALDRVQNLHPILSKDLFNNIEDKVKKNIFSPPTLNEVILNFQEKGKSEILANKFFNHYESVNWMVGKNKMKNWEAAVSSWILREIPQKESKTTYEYGDNEGF